MEDKIKRIMSNIFNIDVESINGDSSPDSIESWDSFNQMNLIVSLEEEFDIELDDNEILEMVSYPLIKLIINSKLDCK